MMKLDTSTLALEIAVGVSGMDSVVAEKKDITSRKVLRL